MGSASTKERGPSPPASHFPSDSRRHRSNGEPSHRGEAYPNRASRSRHNLEQTLFGLGVSHREGRDRDREAERAAREHRKREREAEKQRERARSLREESVDGGFLVTQGVYTGLEDFKDKIVRQLTIERRLAPFFKGLRDHEDGWTDAQLFAAVHDLPIPGPGVEAPREPQPEPKPTPKSVSSSESLTVPIAPRSRSQSYTSDGSARSTKSTRSLGFGRSRSKTLSISSPRDPTLPTPTGAAETNNLSRFVDGRPIEAALYEKAIECPICFMYYPPYLNRTRCCDQDICSECFVQIKRPDPHIPENHDDNPPGENQPEPSSTADQLISEPATCPFCKQPEFGVTYTSPTWRRGLVYQSATSGPLSIDTGSSVSLSGGSDPTSAPASPSSPSWKRRTMLPSSAPEVVTTDMIRPDWSAKLAAAKSHAARRAAAATALHTAAFLIGNNSNQTSNLGSASGGYGRRFMRRAREGSESPSPNASGSGTPRDDMRRNSFLGLSSLVSNGRERETPQREPSVEERLASLGFLAPSGPPSTAGDRREHRNRMVDLEEMMLMEAIRLSLAEEDERKRREETARKEHAEKKQSQKSVEAAAAAGPSDCKGKSVDRSNGESSAAGLSTPSSSSSSRKDEQPSLDESENAGSGEESMFNFSSLAEMIREDCEDSKHEPHHVEHVNEAPPRQGVSTIGQAQRGSEKGMDKGSTVDVGRIRTEEAV